MVTKFILYIGTDEHELSNDSIKNWDDVQCAYKRSDYSGVVRSFTSKFEFVGDAYKLLLNAYLNDGYNADATIAILTITNNWTWEEQFRCPLDFSTISWTTTVLGINAVDNSLSAIIKAEKSTQYEFSVGTDIKDDDTFTFDRLPVTESITYGLTSGESDDDSSEITIEHDNSGHLFVGNTGDEISVGGAIDWLDDQTTDLDSYLFEAVKDVDVTFEYDISYRTDIGTTGTLQLRLGITRSGSQVSTTEYLCAIGGVVTCIGTYTSSSELPDIDTTDTDGSYLYHDTSKYALIDDKVWRPIYMGWYYEWYNTEQTADECFTTRVTNTSQPITISLSKGDRVYISTPTGTGTTYIRICSSSFKFSWVTRGESIDIPVFTPSKVLQTILQKIVGTTLNVSAYISSFDARLEYTRIMAAESIRGIAGAKLYSSFNDFCDWMETVFGYTYYIDEPVESKYQYIQQVGSWSWTPMQDTNAYFTDTPDVSNIEYIQGRSVFRYVVRENNTVKVYADWQGSENYNGTDGHPRTDTLFEMTKNGETALYYFDEYSGSVLAPQLAEFSEYNVNAKSQQVCFVHRSELYKSYDKSDVKQIEYVRDANYSVESSQIYSSVEIGYDEVDYDSINGRDEFNFSITYSTGCTVTDNKLSLISKYRADCYGIEFAAQTRGEDTTDSDSDEDVFFVLCMNGDGTLVPDRTTTIENALSKYVFNGEFSPLSCVYANAGFIGMQAEQLQLTFASSTGNSDIVIDGEPLSGDLILSDRLFTCGVLEFTTNDINAPSDLNDIVEVESGNLIYKGYVSEVTFKYAKSETVEYTIIIKSIESC